MRDLSARGLMGVTATVIVEWMNGKTKLGSIHQHHPRQRHPQTPDRMGSGAARRVSAGAGNAAMMLDVVREWS